MRLDGKAGAAARGLAVLVVVGLLAIGCGDYYRPVANPVFPPGGDPQVAAHVVAIAQNDPNPGTAVVIDVSGDVAVSAPRFVYGERRADHPVHVASTSGILTAFVADRDSGLLTSFSQLSDPSNPPNNTTLPAGAQPVYVAVVPRKVLVAEPGINSIADINILSNPPSLSTQIPVGSSPVALVPLPDGTKVYCINQGSNSVSVIVSANDTVLKTIPLSGTMPVWGAVSTDGTKVFVVNQGSANVSVIDTVGDNEISTFPVGAGPNYAVYQATQNRLYVTSGAGNTLTVYDMSTGTSGIIPVVCNSPLNSNTPKPTGTPTSIFPVACDSGSAFPAITGIFPISVTALADGSRAYVADRDGNSVFVFNALSKKFTKVIQVDPKPVSIASDPGSTRVYTANAGTTVPIASISRKNNTVTANTAVANPFGAGQSVTISGINSSPGVPDPSLEGLFVIASIDSTTHTQFTYSLPSPPLPDVLPPYVMTGTASVSDVSIIQTSTDAVVTIKQADGVTPKAPLTIPVQGTATFIIPTP